MPNPLLDGLMRVLRQVGVRALHRYTQPTRKDQRDATDARPRARFKPKPTDRPAPPSTPREGQEGQHQQRREQEQRRGRPSQQRKGPKPKQQRYPEPTADYPGDYRHLPEIIYAPRPDGEPDPGEIVWTWVPYEEDYSQGKDRPVLLIGRDGPWLLGLQVTSQDNDRDAHEARAGRYWLDIGTGAWDQKRRPSEVRLNRIIRIDPDGVRRIGAILDEGRFNRVANEVAKHY
ncbi:MAG: type II toxin-antitoxin system PemK/MazF family toxin [Propionibacteriaceae bacterium]|nr:type II toxin-antitoxin system PemK/MazF family toxin [Propionibacteriaceae bacterium]